MIDNPCTIPQTKSWQQALKQVVRDPAELCALLNLDKTWLAGAKQASTLFPLRIPREFVALMEKGNPHDPLLRQVLPLSEELTPTPGFSGDPLNESLYNPHPGLLHKYKSRVLLTIAGACAVNCRYCFRRSFPYRENNPGQQGWQQNIDYIKQAPNINEVILSGGDPLMLPDKQLAQLHESLCEIPHLKRIRIHTRFPVMIPQRIDAAFNHWFANSPLQSILIFHINHPNEISPAFRERLITLREKGVTLLNQAVLLKGVNDDLDTLTQLSEALFDTGILPYYLHVLDKVQGTAHFDIPDTMAKALHQGLQAELPGFLVPKLVREAPGKSSKTIIA